MVDPSPTKRCGFVSGAESQDWPLIVIAGPTASGKSALALHLAEALGGELVSCDSVAIYRGLDIGSAKSSHAERTRISHHALDLLTPDQPANAGDYARSARAALVNTRQRGSVPIVAGGTGLYLRALLHGLAPAPPRDEDLRKRLHSIAGRRSLYTLLQRFDPVIATKVHANDTPKLIRSLEVMLLARKPQTEQWAQGREALKGFKVVEIGLNPPRAALYARINQRAAAMFSAGLLEETAAVVRTYGRDAPALRSLGYAQALAVLEGRQSLAEAVAEAQQGHRNYAKRQLTWFRREPAVRWIEGFGDNDAVQAEVLAWVRQHLKFLMGQDPARGGEDA